MSVHGPYPPLRPNSREATYFGRTIRIQVPSIAVAAIPCYFVRLETYKLMVPPHLPKTRAEANITGQVGPTCEDIEHFNTQCQTHFVDSTGACDYFATLTKSQRHDPDWFRVIRYIEPCSSLSLPRPFSFRPGTLSGCWQGSSIVGQCLFAWMLILIPLLAALPSSI